MEKTKITPETAYEEAKERFLKDFSRISARRMSLDAKKEAIEGCLIKNFRAFLEKELMSKSHDRDKIYSKVYTEVENFYIELIHSLENERIISYINQFFETEEINCNGDGTEVFLKTNTLIVISNYPDKLFFTASKLI